MKHKEINLEIKKIIRNNKEIIAYQVFSIITLIVWLPVFLTQPQNSIQSVLISFLGVIAIVFEIYSLFLNIKNAYRIYKTNWEDDYLNKLKQETFIWTIILGCCLITCLIAWIPTHLFKNKVLSLIK